MHGILDQEFILFPGQNDTDRGIISIHVFFFFEVAQVHIHLAYILVASFLYLQVNQNKAFKDAMVKHQVDVVVPISKGNPVLPADKGKALSQLKKKLLKVINDSFLKFSLA